jgi:Uma2 family endonuclease
MISYPREAKTMAISDSKTRYTVDDYWLFPEDNVRREIIDGELHVTPNPIRKHEMAVGSVFKHLRAFLEAHPLGTVYSSPFSVVLSETDVVEPDLVFVAAERAGSVTDDGIEGAPDLVVEVLAGPTRRIDETVKRGLYEEAGVREYWLVDPDERTVRIWRAEKQAFAAPLDLMALAEDAIESPLLPGFSLPLPQIFS